MAAIYRDLSRVSFAANSAQTVLPSVMRI